MKYYWIIDEKRGDVFEEKLDADCAGEAIEIARSTWNRLSKHDKNQRNEFAVTCAGTCEDGSIDYDSTVFWVSFKDQRGEHNPVLSSSLRPVDFDSAVELMDDEIREDLHAEGVDTEQMFFDMYCQRHFEKYGEEFEPNKENPTW